MPGRPSDYSQETANKICERLADGESLRAICLDEDMPARSTVFLWLAANKAFSDQYAYAREAQADTIADEILDIADNSANDWMEKKGQEDAGYLLNGDHVQRSKLRIESRKWLAGKLRPKKYGEKMTLAGDNENPVAIATITRTVVDPKADANA